MLSYERAAVQIPFEDIELATKHFAEENILKRGAKADVYKGILLLQSKLEIDVVIKRYKGYISHFYEGIRLIHGLRHRNVVSFIGICDERDEQMIVMEHVVNGSLVNYVTDPITLTWSQRLHICFGAALALKYWTDDTDSMGLFTKGFKILLNKDWEAKVVFVTGTRPWYETENATLGWILLEVMYGRKVTIEDVNQYVAKMGQKPTSHDAEEDYHDDLDDMIDPNLRKQMQKLSLSIFKLITYFCLRERPYHQTRVAISDIVVSLKEAFEIQWKHENFLWMENFAHLKIPLTQVKLATNNFSSTYNISPHIYHDVYRAELELNHFDDRESAMTRKTVIIKRVNTYNITTKDLYAEIEMHSSCNHPNLLSFHGFCDEDSEKILVFECDSKETLKDYLESESNMTNLTWEKRIHICLDIANGLKYLHNMEGKPYTAHQLIQSTNVFLCGNWTAKIANFKFYDFGFKATPLWQPQHENYRAWWLGRRYVVDDIYSLGVILLEILTGRLTNEYTVDKINKLASMGNLKSRADTRIMEEAQHSLGMFSEITYQCLTLDTRSERPTFEVVIKSLEKALHIQNALLDVQKLGLMKIPLKDIKSATESFDVKFLIGSGGYGSVYQGKLKIKRKVEHCDEPKSVAIKRIASRNDGEGFEGFLDELDVGRKCEHPNIISLIGFCVEDGEMLLVYELASNGSLEDYLEKNDKVNNLSWAKRLKMCIDIAQGLEYMHTTMEDKERIIHRDIKSANILLGKNWEAKIADFGLSKVYNGDKGVSTIKTIHVAGTPFYLDPEYAKTGRLKRASDIYSLGVVLFEIFSGKLAYNQTYTEENNKGLAPIAQRHFENGTLNKILDLKMMDEAFVLGLALKVRPDHHSLEAFSNIAYQCLASTQDKRPTIKDVIDHLKEALQFQENRMKPLKISLEHIKFGTENFSDEKSIRNGEYGMLYKGTIQDNSRHKEVVVKRFTSQEHGFLKEFEVLFKYKHENIIGLVGYCKEMDEKIIVYEHASMGSLDRYLKDTDLSWTKRLMICLDIAKGLKFLHEGDLGQDVVIHRDIRSSNILLNDDWKAKICGFEHALTYPTNQKNEYGIDIFEGSRGYSDPLFQKTRTLTKESDIYSFGVILFEILCGKLACPDDIRDHSLPLDVLVKSHYEAERLEEIVFEGIKKQIVLKSYATFQKIAFQCLQEKREERPTAGDVLVQLQQALEFQEAYEMRKAKLDRTYEEMLHEFSRSPEIYSTMRKKHIYNILSKGILHEDDKLVIKQTIWDLEQSALFIGKHDEDYHSEPEISLTIKTYPKKRQRRHMSRIAFNEETVASSSNITEQTPEKRTRHK